MTSHHSSNASLFTPSNPYWAETHDVANQPSPLENYNLFTTDQALQEAVKHHDAMWAIEDLTRFGARCGSEEVLEWGALANEHKPQFFSHDRHGKRIDEVRYHPAYHQLMRLSMAEGIHSSHWQAKPGGHAARAAKSYMISQIEAGHGCPITMTSAAIPTLRHQAELYAEWAPKILANEYDQRNIPHTQKNSVTIGMAMTEKQGGSDVRANSTRAFPIGSEGPGNPYELVGHKYFVSAPMSDAFLVLAQSKQGISCFLVPRWRPDGTKNPIQIQQLKNKMGNVSNASSETELRGALGWMVGEEGRGIAAILEMVAMTRFDCMVGSSAIMRQAVAQITHHCSARHAFGNRLSEQPLMQNVLADLMLESEAATALSFRMARALDAPADNTHEKNLLRIGTAIGKYWICKRTPGHAYEAMECIGGSGVMENSIMPRLYREAPINTIWEGSGNVQCLDMLRALNKSPDTLESFYSEIELNGQQHPAVMASLAQLKADFASSEQLEYRSRSIVEKMALLIQATTLLQYGNDLVADAFCSARFDHHNKGWVYGTLNTNIDCRALIQRALPV